MSQEWQTFSFNHLVSILEMSGENFREGLQLADRMCEKYVAVSKILDGFKGIFQNVIIGCAATPD